MEPSKIKRAYQNLKNIKILNYECSLNPILLNIANVLLLLNKEFQKILGKRESEYSISKRIIEKNLFGVGFYEKMIEVEKIKLILWLINHIKSKNKIKLPNLNNIRVGNVCWGLDMYEPTELNKLPSPKHVKNKKEFLNKVYYNLRRNEFPSKFSYKDFIKMKPFHWIIEFPHIFKNDGKFDISIGILPDMKEILKIVRFTIVGYFEMSWIDLKKVNKKELEYEAGPKAIQSFTGTSWDISKYSETLEIWGDELKEVPFLVILY